jgi:hypothetical protein
MLDDIPDSELDRLMQMGFDWKVQACVRWMFQTALIPQSVLHASLGPPADSR